MMAGLKEYRQFSCRDLGVDCDFMVRAETEEEVLKHSYDHGCRIHGECDASPGVERKVKAVIKNIWVGNGRFLEG